MTFTMTSSVLPAGWGTYSKEPSGSPREVGLGPLVISTEPACFPKRPMGASTAGGNYSGGHSVFHTLTAIGQSSSSGSSGPEVTVVS